MNNDYLSELERVFSAESEVLSAVQASVASGFGHCIELLLATRGKLVVTGIGKSGIVAHKIAATFSSTGTPAVYLNAGEASHGDLGVVSKGDTVILISNSGNTPELLQMMPSLKQLGVCIIGWLGRQDTPLAQQCDHCLLLHVSQEACPLNLAPMSSATAAMVLGDAVASVLMRASNFTPEQFAVNHPGGALGRKLLLKVKDVMHCGDALPVAPPQASLRELVIRITQGKLGAACIVDEAGKLLGIVTDGDIRRQLMGEVNLERPASEVMTATPITIGPELRLCDALDIMENQGRQIYIVPVIDPEGQAIGMLRMHDIVGER